MPWLAPVTMATDVSIPTSSFEARLVSGEEVADGRRDLRCVRLQSEMAGVEEAHHRVRDVALERLGARRQEERIVLAPHREEAAACGCGNIVWNAG